MPNTVSVNMHRTEMSLSRASGGPYKAFCPYPAFHMENISDCSTHSQEIITHFRLRFGGCAGFEFRI
jgi:hypothetical protein